MPVSINVNLKCWLSSLCAQQQVTIANAMPTTSNKLFLWYWKWNETLSLLHKMLPTNSMWNEDQAASFSNSWHCKAPVFLDWYQQLACPRSVPLSDAESRAVFEHVCFSQMETLWLVLYWLSHRVLFGRMEYSVLQWLVTVAGSLLGWIGFLYADLPTFLCDQRC